MLVLVVVMGFLRMRRSVHAKKIYRIKYRKTKRVCKVLNAGVPQMGHPERNRGILVRR